MIIFSRKPHLRKPPYGSMLGFPQVLGSIRVPWIHTYPHMTCLWVATEVKRFRPWRAKTSAPWIPDQWVEPHHCLVSELKWVTTWSHLFGLNSWDYDGLCFPDEECKKVDLGILANQKQRHRLKGALCNSSGTGTIYVSSNLEFSIKNCGIGRAWFTGQTFIFPPEGRD